MRIRGNALRVVLLPALLLAALVLRAADTPMTKLNIQVKTQSGRPVDRASVIVRFLQGRSIAKLGKHVRTVWELRTNQEGEANIPTVPQGKIRIQVIAKGYQTFGQDFEVDEEQRTVPITLNPPQQQYSAH
ncbi:MAG TPA: carboxypeptidase-like regulatory domain-containing protein [Bryobacteraceae bacterium]|nr:carboxypeptidase-like regulatory domain-containing protein [Bryobacteraceae bacterium]